MCGGRFGFHAVDFLLYDPLDFRERVPAPGGSDDLEDGVEPGGDLKRGDVLRDLHVVDEPFVEARVFTAGENVCKQIELRVSRSVFRRAEPRHVEAGELHLVFLHDPLLRGKIRHGGGLRGDRRTGFDVAEPVFNTGLRFHRIDVPGDNEARVVREIVRPEEIDDVLITRRREVGHRADCGPVIGVIGGIEVLIEQYRCEPVRTVLVPLAALVFDDRALRVHLGGRHGIDEISHPVGFEEEREVRGITRDVLEVVGPLGARRRVVLSSRSLEPLVEFSLGGVFRTHEHQVLEKMREPGASGLLARRSDMVPEVYRHRGDGVVFVEYHVEPVREPEPGITDGNPRIARLCERACDHHKHEQTFHSTSLKTHVCFTSRRRTPVRRQACIPTRSYRHFPSRGPPEACSSSSGSNPPVYARPARSAR